MKKSYFSNTTDLTQLKKEYKTLVKLNHPDNGGSLAIMQEVNSQYDTILKTRIFFTSQQQKETEINFSQSMQKILNKIINFNNVTIEIVGSWIWLEGNTYTIKEALKEIGFKWSSGKKKWYFTEQEFDKRKYKQKNYDTLKNIYGFMNVDTKPSMILT